jgi:hypothetical protein
MAGDLTSGYYPESYTFRKLLGSQVNATQSDLTARTNAEWLGISGVSDGALAATGVACAVAVPVENGDVISKITILVGGTAGATLTHQFAALYSGAAVPALLGQSVDGTSGAIAASAAFSFSLPTPVEVTTGTGGTAPNGFLYASLMVAATTVPTGASVAVPTAVGYQWFSNGPLFLAATHGSSLTGTAPATITGQAAKATAPLVFLT